MDFLIFSLPSLSFQTLLPIYPLWKTAWHYMLPLPKFQFLSLALWLSFSHIRQFSYCTFFYLFLTYFLLIFSYFFLFYLILPPAFFFFLYFLFPPFRATKPKKIPYFWRNFELPTSRLSVNFPYGILSTKNDATRRCHFFFLLPAKHFEIFLRW